VVKPLAVLLLAAAPPQLDYVRLDTREASRDATLARHRPRLEWSRWRICGPFDNAGQDRHDVVYPPETAIDLAAEYAGKDGARAAWRELDQRGDCGDPIDLGRFEGEGLDTDAIAYLHATVRSERAVALPVECGSDDGLKLWVNGRLLVDADSYRGLNVQDHALDLPLVAGENVILAKVTQGAGQWQFQLRPREDPRLMAMLEYRLDRDFPPSPEARHWRLLTVLEPPGTVLEVGGLAFHPDGRPIVATRRGDVYVVGGAYDEPPFGAEFAPFARGLHEPLGAAWRDGALYVAQRGELTRLRDEDGDGRADLFETVADGWGVSGNYHEFAFGPRLDGAGRMWVTLCVGFCGGLGKSIVPWRGWAVIVHADGRIEPVCGGLRAPNGIGRNAEGEMFYTDNQGDWVGTCKLAHLERGSWHGHPSSTRWYAQAGMETPSEADFARPAVWFPYGRMGQSASDIALDETGGAFGPFAGQLFIGDQTNALVMRVALERVAGRWQGACFPFRSGFACGVNRLAFAPDGSLFAGLTSRGWASLGGRSWGLQRLVYTGIEPFEVRRMSARPDGFELEFTQPVDPPSAGSASSYRMSSFTYLRHEKYGSPEVDARPVAITGASVSADGLRVELRATGLRPGYVHELHLEGVRNAAGAPLLHDEAYYTLNAIPAGP
jgi:hypothetical protein